MQSKRKQSSKSPTLGDYMQFNVSLDKVNISGSAVQRNLEHAPFWPGSHGSACRLLRQYAFSSCLIFHVWSPAQQRLWTRHRALPCWTPRTQAPLVPRPPSPRSRCVASSNRSWPRRWERRYRPVRPHPITGPRVSLSMSWLSRRISPPSSAPLTLYIRMCMRRLNTWLRDKLQQNGDFLPWWFIALYLRNYLRSSNGS